MVDVKNWIDRDRLRRGSAVGAALSFLPGATTAARSGGSKALIGGFEQGIDGWKTNGGNELTQVTDDEFVGAVTQGSKALAVEIDGDPFPMIENKKRVKQADFVGSPYLMADVLAVVADTDSDVVFQFRYHHGGPPANAGGGNANKGGKNRQKKSVEVIESPELRVPQYSQNRLYWDMSDVDEKILARPKRLEITWYPADHPPNGGPRGRGPASFDYRGITLFDNVHLSDDPADIGSVGVKDKVTNLKLNHGFLVSLETDELADDVESGRFVFSDGAEVPYTFETLADDRFRYTIGGDAFKLGSGW